MLSIQCKVQIFHCTLCQQVAHEANTKKRSSPHAQLYSIQTELDYITDRTSYYLQSTIQQQRLTSVKSEEVI